MRHQQGKPSAVLTSNGELFPQASTPSTLHFHTANEKEPPTQRRDV